MAGYRLYGRYGSGSMVIEAAFAELGVPCEFVEVMRQADGSFDPAFFRINPRGQVPALMLPDGSVMTETAAMLLHLADAFPASGLAPVAGSPARAQHDRWLTFFHANIYEAMLRLFYSERYVTDPSHAASVKEAARLYILQHFALFEPVISGDGFTFGDKLTSVDLYVWMLSDWIDRGPLATSCPKVLRLYEHVRARPELAGVVARNR